MEFGEAGYHVYTACLLHVYRLHNLDFTSHCRLRNKHTLNAGQAWKGTEGGGMSRAQMTRPHDGTPVITTGSAYRRMP